ncbi:AfsR/SARP family transcriptional regulator [Micromonospora radicis]|nr:AfsR/SARP family transcriptional regulator [Micromonospora radicis]
MPGAPIPIPSGRARALLALLLLNANTVVSTERIVDGMWGERPPATVRTQVHVRVSALRRFLAGIDDATIHTHPAGYRLTIDPGRIDLATFLLLARKGGQALADNRPHEAARALHHALGLWQGDALGGINAPFVTAAVVQLEERWLIALANRIDADLALGRHQELVPELRALLLHRPMLEIARAQLITALHRAGRRADALVVYREGTRLLRDELGVDPGHALTQAYRQLIAPTHPTTRRGDRSLAPPGWSVRRPRPDRPASTRAVTQPKPTWWRVNCATSEE